MSSDDIICKWDFEDLKRIDDWLSNHFTRFQLKLRGWTDKQIKENLCDCNGESKPDKFTHGRDWQMYFYKQDRCLKIEKTFEKDLRFQKRQQDRKQAFKDKTKYFWDDIKYSIQRLKKEM